MDLKRLVQQLNELQDHPDNPIETSKTIMFGYYTNGLDWHEINLGEMQLATHEDFEENSELRLLEYLYGEIIANIEAMRQAQWAIDLMIKRRLNITDDPQSFPDASKPLPRLGFPKL